MGSSRPSKDRFTDILKGWGMAQRGGNCSTTRSGNGCSQPAADTTRWAPKTRPWWLPSGPRQRSLGLPWYCSTCEIPVACSPPGKPDLPGRIGGTFEKCHLETFQSPHAEANVHADWPLTIRVVCNNNRHRYVHRWALTGRPPLTFCPTRGAPTRWTRGGNYSLPVPHCQKVSKWIKKCQTTYSSLLPWPLSGRAIFTAHLSRFWRCIRTVLPDHHDRPSRCERAARRCRKRSTLLRRCLKAERSLYRRYRSPIQSNSTVRG